jgi:hypothetical protein
MQGASCFTVVLVNQKAVLSLLTKSWLLKVNLTVLVQKRN